eukprot:1153299-Pelagomonas_calceolata.AAC.1
MVPYRKIVHRTVNRTFTALIISAVLLTAHQRVHVPHSNQEEVMYLFVLMLETLIFWHCEPVATPIASGVLARIKSYRTSHGIHLTLGRQVHPTARGLSHEVQNTSASPAPSASLPG